MLKSSVTLPTSRQKEASLLPLLRRSKQNAAVPPISYKHGMARRIRVAIRLADRSVPRGQALAELRDVLI